jgi:hypothetical protein
MTSNDFPTTAGVFQATFGGIYDAFIAKIVDEVNPPSSVPAR